MDGISIAVRLAEGIYLWHRKGYQPERLSNNILSLFQHFKASYDSKNIQDLRLTVSDYYSGSFMEFDNKQQLLRGFQGFFEELPFFINPSFTINVYQILEDNDQVFRAVAKFSSKLTVAYIPVKDFDSGMIHVTVTPDGKHGMWVIKSIDQV